MTFAFTDDVARGVLGHMNADHSSDALAIVRDRTDARDATAVEAVGIGDEGMTFRVTAPSGTVDRTIPWGREIRERGDIRAAVVAWSEPAAGDAAAPQGD